MPKKRKAGSAGARAGTADFQSAFEDRSGSKLAMNSWEDVMDEEDEFHTAREKILLDEEPDRKRARRMREEEAAMEDSEVEVLDVPDSDDEDDEVEDDDGYGDIDGGDYDVEEEEEDVDLEITGRKKKQEDEDDLEGWGTSRKDLYGDDELETEADALAHEAEAKRIQEKQLAEMNDADFGFGDDDWGALDTKDTGKAELDEESGDEGEAVVELLPQITIAADASQEQRLKVLQERYPEFESLQNEFLNLQTTFSKLQQRLGLTDLGAKADHANSSVVAIVKYQALASYLATLTMYFALLTSTADQDGQQLAKQPTELRDHNIMQSIVEARITWIRAKGLSEHVPLSQQKMDSSPSIQLKDEIEMATVPTKALQKKKLSKAEAAKLQSHARRAARIAAVDADLAELADLTTEERAKSRPQISSSFKSLKNGPVQADDDSDLGDDTELNQYEQAAKAAKRKSLRFYTSQITQKSMKRTARGQEIGGDADIPYRERWRDRQARLQAEAEKRQNGSNGVEPGPRSGGPASKAEGSDDEYQDLVARSNKAKAEKKQAKRDAYAAAQAAKDAEYEDGLEVIGEDGKRRINYQIEKNKGLAPHRKKDVRNPRVKKRKKYEEKKKKLSSVRAVYKGGPGPGGYRGELTGIKTGLVKGVKLS